jgi:hypothetical protein
MDQSNYAAIGFLVKFWVDYISLIYYYTYKTSKTRRSPTDGVPKRCFEITAASVPPRAEIQDTGKEAKK